MLNSEPTVGASDTGTQQDGPVNASQGSSGKGAAALAGLATAIVVAIWFAFYLLVFVPRATGP